MNTTTTTKNELTITVPRDRWLRGTDDGSSTEGVLVAQRADGEYDMCIMGWVGHAHGISPASMYGLSDLADCEDLMEDHFHEAEGAALLRRGILTIGENDLYESPPEVIKLVSLNDDAGLTEEDREAAIHTALLAFNIHVRFTE